MVELKFLVRCPMDCWRQWIRHRTASVNEYSTRYSEAIDSAQTTSPGEWRAQSTTNKQGSGDFVTEWPADCNDLKSEGQILLDNVEPSLGRYLSIREEQEQRRMRDLYEERIRLGVAREQARKDLPLSTYTQAYWKIDLHNLFHFLSLRMDSHAQKEIREYATIIGEKIVAPLFPLCWKAFEDYRLKGMFLSRLDIEAIASCLTNLNYDPVDSDMRGVSLPENKREREETIAKLKRLGF